MKGVRGTMASLIIAPHYLLALPVPEGESGRTKAAGKSSLSMHKALLPDGVGCFDLPPPDARSSPHEKIVSFCCLQRTLKSVSLLC